MKPLGRKKPAKTARQLHHLEKSSIKAAQYGQYMARYATILQEEELETPVFRSVRVNGVRQWVGFTSTGKTYTKEAWGEIEQWINRHV